MRPLPCFPLLIAIGVAFSGCTSDKQDTSLEANRMVVRKFHQIWSTGQIAQLDSVMTPDFVFHYTNGNESKGIDSTKLVVAQVRTLFPDTKHEILDLIAEGDRVVARYKVTATHQNKFDGYSPTGKKLVMSVADIYRIDNGKIAEEWQFANQSDLDNQLKAKN